MSIAITRSNREEQDHGHEPAALPAGQEAGTQEQLTLLPALLRALREALRAIRYGTVELVIHDGRVVQLERSGEKCASIMSLQITPTVAGRPARITHPGCRA